MKNSIERKIVANLAWRYRYAVTAYNLVSSNEHAPKLYISLAQCKVKDRYDAYITSKMLLQSD